MSGNMAGGMPWAVPRSRLIPPRARGLGRPRVDALLQAGLPTGLVLVDGPPGCGKTSAVAQWTATCVRPVAWYRAVAADPAVEPSAQGTVFDHLGAALAATAAPGDTPGDGGGGTTAHDLVARLEASAVAPVLVVDDVHLLGPVDTARLAEFALDAVDSVCLVLVGREVPGWHLARGELAGRVHLDEGDLRFRPWEVETLFRERYGVSLRSADAVELTRRTAGWAAALTLLHNAFTRTGGGTPGPALLAVAEQGRYAAAYLADQVFAATWEADREFLRRTAVLETLTVDRCNALLERDDSAAVLRRLRQAPLVLHAGGSGEVLRVHPVVRRHALAELTERLGPEATRQWHARAAEVLATRGSVLEHLLARCRAQDAEGVCRLLDEHGPALTAGQTDAWVRLLPPGVLGAHPWAGLGHAVALLEDGRFGPAVAAARAARGGFTDPRGRRLADHVMRRAGVWTSEASTAPVRWEDVLRAATVRDPASAAHRAQSLESPMRLVCEGVALILAGNHERAAVVLRAGVHDREADTVARLSARLLLAAVAALGDRGTAVGAGGGAGAGLDTTHTEAEAHGLWWLARMARGIAVAHGGGRVDLAVAAGLVAECDENDDPWGAALIALACSLAELRAGACDVVALEALVERFRTLDAGVLEAWTRALYAVTAVGERLPDALRDARLAEALAKANSVPGALALAYAALGASDARGHAEYAQLAATTARAAGLGARPWTWLRAARAHTGGAPPGGADGSAPPTRTSTVVVPAVAPTRPRPAVGAGDTPTPGAPSLQLRCFGGFGIELDGREVDLTRVRPRARAVLRLLALHAGRPVHRELLAEMFWPDLTVAAALHNLHVAVSSLRGALEPAVAPRSSRLLVRDGQAYLLVLSPEAVSDLREFDLAVRVAAAARHRGDDPARWESLQRATELYAGDVLPEDGPAEWVVEVRDEYRMRAAESAHALAAGRLAAGDPAAAAQAAAAAVRVDRWHDGAWRLLVDSLERTGDRAAAGRARAGYAAVLDGLDVG